MKRIISIFLLSIILVLSGCKGESKNEEANFKVVASFTPIHALTLAVTKGAKDIEVTCMTSENTGCLHDYQLLPADMQAVEDANVYIINGVEMESAFLGKITTQYKDLIIADSSKGAKLLEQENMHEHEEDGEEHSHEHNQHIWMSLQNAVIQVKNIAKELSNLNPENKEIYNSNAEDFSNKASSLKAEFEEKLSNVSNRKIISYHEGFVYLANEFGLEVEAVIESGDGNAPDPQSLQGIINIIKEEKINTILTEPQYSDDTAKLIASETNAKLYSLDTIVTGEMTADSYINIMRSNLQKLEGALK